jgi:hypothetical protein
MAWQPVIALANYMFEIEKELSHFDDLFVFRLGSACTSGLTQAQMLNKSILFSRPYGIYSFPSSCTASSRAAPPSPHLS